MTEFVVHYSFADDPDHERWVARIFANPINVAEAGPEAQHVVCDVSFSDPASRKALPQSSTERGYVVGETGPEWFRPSACVCRPLPNLAAKVGGYLRGGFCVGLHLLDGLGRMGERAVQFLSRGLKLSQEGFRVLAKPSTKVGEQHLQREFVKGGTSEELDGVVSGHHVSPSCEAETIAESDDRAPGATTRDDGRTV